MAAANNKRHLSASPQSEDGELDDISEAGAVPSPPKYQKTWKNKNGSKQGQFMATAAKKLQYLEWCWEQVRERNPKLAEAIDHDFNIYKEYASTKLMQVEERLKKIEEEEQKYIQEREELEKQRKFFEKLNK